jgi:hypothetical protein
MGEADMVWEIGEYGVYDVYDFGKRKTGLIAALVVDGKGP